MRFIVYFVWWWGDDDSTNMGCLGGGTGGGTKRGTGTTTGQMAPRVATGLLIALGLVVLVALKAVGAKEGSYQAWLDFLSEGRSLVLEGGLAEE